MSKKEVLEFLTMATVLSVPQAHNSIDWGAKVGDMEPDDAQQRKIAAAQAKRQKRNLKRKQNNEH